MPLQYFLWRQSTWNDLQLILGLNFIMLIVGVLLKTSFVDNLDARMEGRAAEPLSATALLSNAYGVSPQNAQATAYRDACCWSEPWRSRV